MDARYVLHIKHPEKQGLGLVQASKTECWPKIIFFVKKYEYKKNDIPSSEAEKNFSLGSFPKAAQKQLA